MSKSDSDVFSFEELVNQFVPRESNGDATVAEVRDSTAISLHHVHLPKLADFGIIEYDAERKRARYDDGSGDIFGGRDVEKFVPSR